MAWSSLKSVFSKSKHIDFSIDSLGVDLHSHLLPGIDDGARTMDESIELIKGLKALGYSKLITTPHIMSDTYPNSSEIIRQALSSVQEQLKNNGIEIQIEAASEYYLDEHFIDLLKTGDILTFGDNYVLFETSYTIRPFALYDHIYAIASRGYRPLLAHPERYHYLNGSLEEYIKIRDMGVYFQLNINSVGGYYSRPVQKTAQMLIENGMIDFVGSDTHRMRHIEFLGASFKHPLIETLMKKNAILNTSLF